jgi:hypothetical protein
MNSLTYATLGFVFILACIGLITEIRDRREWGKLLELASKRSEAPHD